MYRFCCVDGLGRVTCRTQLFPFRHWFYPHHSLRILFPSQLQMSDKPAVKADALAAGAAGLKKTETVEKNTLPTAA